MAENTSRDAQDPALPPGRSSRTVRGGCAHPRDSGRQIVLLGPGAGRAGLEILHGAAGVRVALSSEFAGTHGPDHLAAGEAVLFELLGAALVCADPDQARALARAQGQVLRVVPERHLRGHSLMSALTTRADTDGASWGLRATGAASSSYTGRGIRVAILDTGLDFEHPDFAGRSVVSESFVSELSARDGNGHGTFCAGVACGPVRPAGGPRYGVAPEAELYIARVLDDRASGLDGNVLAGIDWAVRNQCAVVSMSLGSPVLVGDPFPEVYEQAAARALAAGTLLIAPAGNESQRPDEIAPVEHPANCPSILAVGAVDRGLRVAPFSNGGLNPGGDVDLVAPGIAIGSAAPHPSLYQTASGTSMAAPYVAGIAALLAEAHPRARGAELRDLLVHSALAMGDPARDAGAGLVQAPQ